MNGRMKECDLSDAVSENSCRGTVKKLSSKMALSVCYNVYYTIAFINFPFLYMFAYNMQVIAWS